MEQSFLDVMQKRISNSFSFNHYERFYVKNFDPTTLLNKSLLSIFSDCLECLNSYLKIALIASQSLISEPVEEL